METGIHELTAGYALDALDPDERRAYEEHLEGCERCREELELVLADHGVARGGRLGAGAERESCAGASSRARAPSRRTSIPLDRARPARVPALAAVAAVAAVVRVAVGIWAIEALGRPRRRAARAGARARGGGAPRRPARARRRARGGRGTPRRLARRAGGAGAGRARSAPEGKTYMAWIIDGETPVPAGAFLRERRDGRRPRRRHRRRRRFRRGDGRGGDRRGSRGRRRSSLRAGVGGSRLPGLRVRREKGVPRRRRRVRKRRLAALLVRAVRALVPRPSRSGSCARSRARSRPSTPRRSGQTSTPTSTPRTAARCSPCSAARRAASSSRPRTSRRSCGRRSSRSRTSASSSTTASTCAASCARSGRTSAARRSSRAARRSRSSSSRTPTSATSGRSRARCARPRSRGSSRSSGRKDRILTAYLNTIYFGNGAYGIQQAARTYFQKGARYLELHEAALLAGLPADPARYDPVDEPAEREGAPPLRARADARAGEDHASATSSARTARRCRGRRTSACPGTGGKAQYFVNYVKDQLVEQYGAGQRLRRRAHA